MEEIQSPTNEFEALRNMDGQDGVSQASVNGEEEEESPSSNDQLVGYRDTLYFMECPINH
jgi:hypothetical protein